MEELTGILRQQAEGTEKYQKSFPYIQARGCLPIEVILGLKQDLSEPFTLLLQTPEMVMSEISTIVITSYSIHYTKLYEFQ